MEYNQISRDNQSMFSNLDQSQVARALNQHFWYNGYAAGDFVVKFTMLMAIYHNHRLVKGKDGKMQFMSEREFINDMYPTNRKEGKIMFKNNKVTLYDAYTLKNGVITPKDQYAQYINTKLENKIKNMSSTLASRLDGAITEEDKSAIHAHYLASYLILHKNFMLSGLHNRFKSKHFNFNTNMVEEGQYVTTGRLVSDTLKNLFSEHKINVLKQLLHNYENMSDDEKYNVRRTIRELVYVSSFALCTSIMLLPLADDKDYKDDFFIQATTYLALRIAFELRTMYNPLELKNLLNSPTAATSLIDNFYDLCKILWIPSWFSNKNSFSEVASGPYKGYPRLLRSFIKITPFKNIIEATDPKYKRLYLQNQLEE